MGEVWFVCLIGRGNPNFCTTSIQLLHAPTFSASTQTTPSVNESSLKTAADKCNPCKCFNMMA